MAGIKEACGVFGIYDLDGGNVVPSIYYGLTSLQHRGQESCGLAVSRTDGERGNVQFSLCNLLCYLLRVHTGFHDCVSEEE